MARSASISTAPDSSDSLRARLQASGILRRGGPRNGFRYRRANGAPVSQAERARIERLRIPSAWREVAISTSSTARVQAIGLDAAGRWQYLYVGGHTARSARRKFDRLVAFARALPALRASLRRDLARDGIPGDRATAAALLLLTAAALRPGTGLYARTNRTFGLATLRPEHVEVRGRVVRLGFRGKHGVRQRHELRSPRLARLVREMLRIPGRELFKYRDARGRLRDLNRDHVNRYVKRVMGERFSARDFRTWSATLVCAAQLARPSGASRAERAAAIRRAMIETARWLGNTPKVARASYVHPRLLAAYHAGRTVKHALARPEILAERVPGRLHRAERALVELIEG